MKLFFLSLLLQVAFVDSELSSLSNYAIKEEIRNASLKNKKIKGICPNLNDATNNEENGYCNLLGNTDSDEACLALCIEESNSMISKNEVYGCQRDHVTMSCYVYYDAKLHSITTSHSDSETTYWIRALDESIALPVSSSFKSLSPPEKPLSPSSNHHPLNTPFPSPPENSSLSPPSLDHHPFNSPSPPEKSSTSPPSSNQHLNIMANKKKKNVNIKKKNNKKKEKNKMKNMNNKKGNNKKKKKTSTCVDGNKFCPDWAKNGECEANPGYMLKNCKKSCKVCTPKRSPTSNPTPSPTRTEPCVDGNISCPGWAKNGECEANPGYMLKNCKKSCNVCTPKTSPTSNPTPSPTRTEPCVDGNISCPGWAKNGECKANPGYMLENCKKSCKVCIFETNIGDSCKSDSDCDSDFCDLTTNICYASPKCKALKHSLGETFNENKVVIVFVGSDFTNIETWKNQVVETFSRFEDFPFFGEKSDYVAFYVNELSGSYCECGCFNIDRLLCCEAEAAYALAEKCFPSVAQLQVVAVHNTFTYCNGGGTIAAVSRNKWGPIVGVHEVGHSLFGLQDEYDWDYKGSDDGPNCDSSPGCPRWSDLLPYFPDICTYKGCDEGDYFISEKDSFMNGINTNVGPVLRRFTCCTFYALTGQAPGYCEDLVNLGQGLYSFCENSGYSPPPLLLATDSEGEHKKISTPSGTFIYISKPFKFVIDLSSWKDNSTYSATFEQLQGKKKLYAGFYDSSMIYGDELTPERAAKLAYDECVKVKILFESGRVDNRYYLTTTILHAPPALENSNISVPSLVLKIPKSSIIVMVEESLDPISLVTAKLECQAPLH